MDKKFAAGVAGGSIISIISGIMDEIQGMAPQKFPKPWNDRLSPYLPSNGQMIERVAGAGVGELFRQAGKRAKDQARARNVKALGFGMEVWSLLDTAKIVGVRAAYAAGHPGVGQNPSSWTWPIGLSYRNATPTAGPAEPLPFQSDMTY